MLSRRISSLGLTQWMSKGFLIVIGISFYISVLLTGCAEKTQETKESNETIAAFHLTVQKEKLSKTLHIFNFPDYLNQDLMDEFERVYGVEIIQDYYDNNEVLIAKLQAGGAGQYDIVVVSDYAITILLRKHLLETLDLNNIPNIANLEPRFRGMPFDRENQYSICYTWGTIGLGVRMDLIKDKTKEIDTWKILFDPAYQVGPIVMLDSPRETIGAALKYLGYPVNSTDEKQLKEAEELLISQKKRVLAYTSLTTGRDLLTSGDATVCYNFNGDIYIAREEKASIEYVLPREGTIIWTDNLAIPTKAPHKYTAEVFINFILDGEMGGRLANFTHYATPNLAALPFVEPKFRENKGIFTAEEITKNLEFLEDVGEATKLYDATWTRIKASSK